MEQLDNGKAVDLLKIDLAGRVSFADYLVIASGTSSRHVMGLVNNLAVSLRQKGYHPVIEGKSGSGNWVVLDLKDVIVHVFNPETRAYYALDKLWK